MEERVSDEHWPLSVPPPREQLLEEFLSFFVPTETHESTTAETIRVGAPLIIAIRSPQCRP